MIVNGKEYKAEDFLKNIDKNFLEKVGNIMLTKREIEVLERNFIDYKSSTSLRDLMMKIEYELDNDELDSDSEYELDDVLESISERAYYLETNK